MKRLLVYWKDYKRESVLAPLFKLLEAFFELLVPLVMAQIINKGIGSSDMPYIMRMSGVLILLAVVGLVFSITAQYFSAYVAVYTAAEIRQDVFKKILSLSISAKEKVGDDVLTTRITNDINQIQNAINMVLRLFLRSPFIVVGAMIMAIIIDIKSSFIFAVTILALGLVVFFIMRYTLPRYKSIAARLEKVLHNVSENLDGIRVIRAFNRNDIEQIEYASCTSDLKSMQISTGRVAALLNPITYVIVNLGIVILIAVSAYRVDGGFILQGDIVALVNYMSQILVELIKLANLIVILMKAFPSADRVQELMEMKSDERKHLVGKTENESTKDISISHLSFSYTNKAEYDLDDITLDIPAGSTMGIVGGTGAGKSTLINLLNHTYDVTKGEIALGGVDICNYSDEELAQIFGIVPQRASLFSGTVRSNLKMKSSNEAQDDELIEALIAAQAWDFLSQKDGLDTVVTESGRNFSGGQRQRLTIARALVGRPRILILDDSASALDLLTESKLWTALSKLSWHPTIIIVSQRVSSVMDADNILVLDDGQCVGYGKHNDLMKNCKIYQEIYYCQYPKKEAANE